ncbi:hypothetical protein PRUPE_2G049300 [Prunus persica]|uniref:Uncharacterized protein n=1 Tax=Prunus persica TaxID=3760 RepID=A0A251QB45_PRUPE|nr:hypothetical protein PRUPE_2G049300 [Prunus persica]
MQNHGPSNSKSKDTNTGKSKKSNFSLKKHPSLLVKLDLYTNTYKYNDNVSKHFNLGRAWLNEFRLGMHLMLVKNLMR